MIKVILVCPKFPGKAEKVVCASTLQEKTDTKHAMAVFSASEPHVVLYTSGALEGKIIFFDSRNSRIKRRVDLPTGSLLSLAVSLNGVWIAAGSRGGCVFLLEYINGSYQEFEGHRQPVTAVQFSQCDTVLISAASGLLMSWEIRNR